MDEINFSTDNLTEMTDDCLYNRRLVTLRNCLLNSRLVTERVPRIRWIF
jgi:predicted pyridoxine 5'-phosphate oxidase superfamily flavin-nucleotide-binding protein